VRADQADAGPGDSRHPDEVVGPGEEGGEGRGERPVAAHADTHRRGDQLLLGDVHLEVPAGVRLGEKVGIGRVADLAVHRHHVVTRAERGERLPVGLAGGHVLAAVVDRRLDLGPGPVEPGGSGLGWPRAADGKVSLAAELDDGPFGHVGRERPAVPALPVLDLGEASALAGTGQDDGRPFAAEVACPGDGLVDRGDVVTVDGVHPGPERLRPAAVGIGVPGKLRGAALAEAVDVDDGDEVGQLVVRGLIEGLPHRPFGHLAVAAQDPDPVGRLVQVLACQRHADSVRQALPERAGRHVHPGQHRGRMAFQPRSEAAVSGHQLLVGDHPDRLVDGVQQRRSVPLGEDEVVVAGVIRVVPVIAEVPAYQDGHQVGGGHTGGRMPGTGRRARPDGVHPQLLAKLGGEREVDVGGWGGHGHLLKAHRSPRG